MFTNVGIDNYLLHTFVRRGKWDVTFNSRTTVSIKPFCFVNSVVPGPTMPYTGEACIMFVESRLNKYFMNTMDQ